jgi:low affinity Fe/Cu permease
MSLLWKIMLSTSVAITCLLAVAGWMVQNHFVAPPRHAGRRSGRQFPRL